MRVGEDWNAEMFDDADVGVDGTELDEGGGDHDDDDDDPESGDGPVRGESAPPATDVWARERGGGVAVLFPIRPLWASTVYCMRRMGDEEREEDDER